MGAPWYAGRRAVRIDDVSQRAVTGMVPSSPLVEAFLGHAPAAARDALAAVPDLDGVLTEHVRAAQAAWPAIVLAPSAFVAYVAERLPESGAASAFAGLHINDLWVAAGCVAGDRAAVDALERRFIPELDGVLSRAGADLKDELRQRVREKLLVAESGASPRVGAYVGRGPLVGWLKVVASRVAVDFLRAREPASDEDELLGVPAAGSDPELSHLRARYKAEFREAMHTAARELDARARNVLRLHYVDGLTMEEIAALYRVHRLTAVRWVTDARDSIGATTRRVLLQRFGVGKKELDSILGLMQSQLDVSLRALLRTATRADE